MVTCDVFDSTQKESTTPMGLPYHCPLITTTTTGMVRIMAIYHRTTTWGVTMPSRGIALQISGACARKGAGEVTPKGLYGREGRVDERSEIYPV